MQGEIGIKIKEIKLTQFRNENNYDMTIIDINNDHFHIVGNNDLKTLLEDALSNIHKFPHV